MIRVSWLYFVCALFYQPIENSAFIAYGQQLYLQGFQTVSSFIVNLESSLPVSVITVFINSRSRSSAVLLT